MITTDVAVLQAPLVAAAEDSIVLAALATLQCCNGSDGSSTGRRHV